MTCRFCDGAGCLSCAGTGRIFATPTSHLVARTSDPDTSWQAAESVTPVTLTRTRTRILQLLSFADLTDEQLLEVVWTRERIASRSGTQTRRRELVDAGLVEDTGRRVRGSTGRSMIVWRITDAGRASLVAVAA